ncbi:hypothetical protein DMH25_33740 [Streptomyces sp. WAC 01325]|uniref:hypothetical protein n=1 Tax=Streptomyces sp. WAC 01325 TaxID=2203202 RepID=UPI000F89BBEF|nr:hypothetical protein [Streptomyces sp. WAC 01325]RSM94790.1 hypothetical protein DMH25_33740 [Streptomyces sp. WAC 01325]
MTQSGRSEEPSARPAREGIVLPSDGGEPLLPGMTGGQGGRPTSVPATPPTAPQPSAPPGGQSWGTPWGPEQNPPAQGQAWGAQPGHEWGRQGQQPGQAPQQPEQAYQLPQQDHQAYQPPQQNHQAYQPPQQNHQAYQSPQHDQSYQSPSPAPWGAAPEAGGGMPAQPMPQDGGPYGGGAQGPAAGAPSYGQSAPAGYGQGGASSAPLPPEGRHGQGAALPPAGGFGAPLPPADEGATQYIPPVAGGPMGADDQATSFLPPVAAPAADEGATQFIPPVGPGALPPEVSSESTQVLGRAGQAGGAGPMPPVSGGDADATQYIPPVTDRPGGGERQPLSDFDNLFRSDSAGQAPAGATQHLPRFQQPQPQQHQQAPAFFPPGQQGAGDDDGGRGGRGGRTGSRLPLIAAVGVGIAVLGIGAGALLAGGGGDDGKGEENQPVSATAPANEESASPSADPAEQQAVALDKLLADSGDSRTSVINAVDAVKSCDNLGKAAQDLRDAARQRKQLVTDLSKLSVDQLPNHAALTGALNKAWQASASADDHYAAWADQVAGNKKLCNKGQARSTGQTQAGNRASGTASEQKKTASGLWNQIAKKYGLTERQPTQL